METPPLEVQPRPVLVVDDEAGMRELLLALFRRNGFETVAAPDADQAFTLAAETDPTVAIIDYRIAGGGGISLIARLRKHSPGLRCIFMTAYDDPACFAEAIEAGACDTIRKPFDILELVARVKRQIELAGSATRGASQLG